METPRPATHRIGSHSIWLLQGYLNSPKEFLRRMGWREMAGGLWEGERGGRTTEAALEAARRELVHRILRESRGLVP